MYDTDAVCRIVFNNEGIESLGSVSRLLYFVKTIKIESGLLIVTQDTASKRISKFPLEYIEFMSLDGIIKA